SRKVNKSHGTQLLTEYCDRSGTSVARAANGSRLCEERRLPLPSGVLQKYVASWDVRDYDADVGQWRPWRVRSWRWRRLQPFLDCREMQVLLQFVHRGKGAASP